MSTITQIFDEGSQSFDDFEFKGFGLSITKALHRANSFGINFKIPISSNFPKYDNTHYYPKLSSSIGISYPLDYKFSLAASFPMMTAIYCKSISIIIQHLS